MASTQALYLTPFMFVLCIQGRDGNSLHGLPCMEAVDVLWILPCLSSVTVKLMGSPRYSSGHLVFTMCLTIVFAVPWKDKGTNGLVQSITWHPHDPGYYIYHIHIVFFYCIADTSLFLTFSHLSISGAWCCSTQQGPMKTLTSQAHRALTASKITGWILPRTR